MGCANQVLRAVTVESWIRLTVNMPLHTRLPDDLKEVDVIVCLPRPTLIPQCTSVLTGNIGCWRYSSGLAHLVNHFADHMVLQEALLAVLLPLV